MTEEQEVARVWGELLQTKGLKFGGVSQWIVGAWSSVHLNHYSTYWTRPAKKSIEIIVDNRRSHVVWSMTIEGKKTQARFTLSK